MIIYWMASDLGRAEVTTKLAAIYEKREIFEKDIEKSERLKRMLVIQFHADGLEWRISQEDKTLFIRGNGRMNNYNSTMAPWEDYRYKFCR